MFTYNLDKAKEIKKDMLRQERAPMLQSLDVQFQRALESGADTKAIVNEKQRLRDVPQLVDGASTLDEIKSITC